MLAIYLKIKEKGFVNNKTMSAVFLAIILLCVSEVISKCPPDSGM